MNGEESGYIPASLDTRERFLWWEIDQLVLMVMLTAIGIVADAMFFGALIGTVMAWQYGRLKAGKHPNFAIHTLYWWLPSRFFVKTRTTPPSSQRYFLG
ncbi:MAG: type IV conjugative transfer system protein TraL [Nitrosomonas sp.]|uniref:Conjugal transfer pilus assembly protein TraL n=1 Tax=Nitrosomonas aestuarii TaxID=52441 RepID=A0A1I4DJ09_9PROT|nr:type IV conjugative transfer system protein TraL [Nitrosomonas aestuarii]MBX3630303.1 type IV conjugative transfer system protein TraL [Nitrosomonas sp.]SFK93522.1 conjugal transfer pilus assembly protein TraL [Nitrosomonas aestuarii]